MKLTESQIVEHIKEFIEECDADELGRIAGDIFCGECYPTEEILDDGTYDLVFDFEPGAEYFGEFDDNEQEDEDEIDN